jgi:hypothetical protein
LNHLRSDEIENEGLLRDALSGYLPPSWLELVVASRASWASRLPFDVRALLSEYDRRPDLSRAVRGFATEGQTDRLDEITTRLSRLLEGPEAGVLAAERQITLASFEALLADLPGDQRDKLVEALGRNPTATSLVDVQPEELCERYANSPAQRKIRGWSAEGVKQHRVGLAVTALSAHLAQNARLTEIKRSNTVRASLGVLLAELPERWALDLVAMCKRLGITPIRPS